jgi:hypothetical protein
MSSFIEDMTYNRYEIAKIKYYSSRSTIRFNLTRVDGWDDWGLYVRPHAQLQCWLQLRMVYNDVKWSLHRVTRQIHVYCVQVVAHDRPSYISHDFKSGYREGSGAVSSSSAAVENFSFFKPFFPSHFMHCLNLLKDYCVFF